MESVARRNMWSLVSGQSVSLLGDYLAFFFALPVLVRDLTGSAAQLGLLAVAETAAVLAFGLLAGVLLDRVRIRWAIVFADLARAAAFALLAVAVVADAARPWMAFGVAFIVGSMGTIFDAGLEGLMPSALPSDALVIANSRLQTGRNLAMTLGFVVGGIAVAGFGGVAGAFAFDSASYLVSVVAVLLIREIRPRERAPVEPIRPALAAGLRFLWDSVPLRWATGISALTNAAFAPLAAVMTLYADVELGIESEAQLGLFFAGFSLVGAGGVFLAPALVRLVGLGPAMAIGAAAFGTGAVVVGMADGWWAVAPLGIAAAGVATSQVAFMTLRQQLTPRPMVGRVIAASRTAAWAGIPAGAALGGWIADAIGLRPLFIGGGLIIVWSAVAIVLGPLGSLREVAVTEDPA